MSVDVFNLSAKSITTLKIFNYNYSERSKYFYFDSFKMNIISTDTEAQSKNFNGVYHIISKCLTIFLTNLLLVVE